MQKRFKYLSLVLCFVFICGSFVFVPKKNDVKAFLPIAAGEAFVYAICLSMGIYGTAEAVSSVTHDIYMNLGPDLKAIADDKGRLTNSWGTSAVNVTRDQYNAFVQKIVEKFGEAPEPVYEETAYGELLTTTNGYSSVVSPIDVTTSKVLWQGLGTGSYTTQYGGFTYQFNTSSTGTTWCIVTCPDGFKFRANTNVYCKGGYTTQFYFYAPIMYSSTSNPPDIKFFAHSDPGTYVPAGSTVRADIYIESVVGSGNFNTYAGSNAGPYMSAHIGDFQTKTLNIDQEQYQEKAGDTTSTDDVILNISTDMDKMVTQTADTVTALDGVNTSVKDIGVNITDGIRSLGDTIVGGLTTAINAVKTAVESMSTTLSNAMTTTQTKVTDIANAITAPATVPINFVPLQIAGATVATKFPFCIPFDLINSISSLNVAAVAPHWVINFDSGYFVGGGQVDVDFEQFESWAQVVRWGLLIIFSVGLISVTRRMIGGE